MKMAIAHCPRCSCEFALPGEVVEEMEELTCPRCERTFDAPETNELEAPTFEDDDEDSLEDGMIDVIPMNPRRRAG